MRDGLQRHIVTGGLGFIGRHLVTRLLRDPNNQVRIVDDGSRIHNTDLAFLENERVFLHEIDLSQSNAIVDSTSLYPLFSDSIVWHLAAVNGTKNFYDDPRRVIDVAILSIMNVSDACQRNGASKLVVASSSEVYQQPIDIPTSEVEPCKIPDLKNPRFSYALGKMVTEAYTHYVCETVPYVIFRPHNFYGPNSGHDHIIPEIVEKIRVASEDFSRACRIELLGTGKETRSFCHISDGIDGIVIVGTRGISGETYHIGTEEEVTVESVVTKVISKLDIDVEIVWNGISMIGATSRRCPDITKVRSLGYEPKVTLDEGLERLLTPRRVDEPA